VRLGGGDNVGIDPQQVGDLITSISNGTSADGGSSAQPLVNGWMDQASACGLDTARLSNLNKDLAWAQDQIPMLQRRQSLALDLQVQNYDLTGIPQSGMVEAGAMSLGNFSTVAAAEKAGEADAKAFTNGSMSLQDLMNQLADNGDDPDYCKAVFQTLGLTGLLQLAQESPGYNPDDPALGESVIAIALAEAMRNGYTLSDPNEGEKLSLLAPLLSQATFPPQVLAQLGSYCMAPGNYEYADEVFKALADDPTAAAYFLQHYSANIPWFLSQGPNSGLPDYISDDFYNVVQAGTLGEQGIYPQAANAATQSLVMAYYDAPGVYAYNQKFDALYDQIVASNWSAVQQAIADPAPAPGSGQINLNAAQWQAFISEGMQNSTAGAHLLAFAGQQAYQVEISNPDNAFDLHTTGVIQGFFSQTALNVYQQMVHDQQTDTASWRANFSAQLQAVAGAGVDIALDPQHAASVAIGDAVKDIIAMISTAWVDSANPPAPNPPDVYGWRTDWTQAASTAYLQNPDIGNPKMYEQEYSSGKPFLDAQGNLVNDASMAQQEAYDAWLKDEALSAAIASKLAFTGTDQGRLDGEDEAGNGANG
jgi:hypothetical protein